MRPRFPVPIALFIFNRPDTTRLVFDVIHEVRPIKLFVVADGPRDNKQGEKEKCEAARSVIQSVDWECEVKTNFSDLNMGCKDRVSSGISWVFDQVEEAIILEDDCVPNPTFFPFCQELLDRYRNDERVMVISGDNFQQGRKRTKYSYYFSMFSHCWGWATWRRAWCYYDNAMKLWPYIRDHGYLETLFDKKRDRVFWRDYFQNGYDEKINSWALRWIFACWIQSGLTILPNVNLVSNIGFDLHATHTKDKNTKLACLTAETVEFPLRHPPFLIRNSQADDFTQKTLFNPSQLSRVKSAIARILHKEKE